MGLISRRDAAWLLAGVLASTAWAQDTTESVKGGKPEDKKKTKKKKKRKERRKTRKHRKKKSRRRKKRRSRKGKKRSDKRRALIVSGSTAVGYELVVPGDSPGQPDAVVVVKEVRKEPGGEVMVTVGPDGTVQEFDVDREDDPSTTEELLGTELAANEVAPFSEVEVDEEYEEEVEVEVEVEVEE